MARSDNDEAARLLERIVADPEFRARYRRDPAAAAREMGVRDDRDADAPLETLEIRESRSSLAGAFAAVAVEGMGFYELVSGHAGPLGPAEAYASERPPVDHPEAPPAPGIESDPDAAADVDAPGAEPDVEEPDVETDAGEPDLDDESDEPDGDEPDVETDGDEPDADEPDEEEPDEEEPDEDEPDEEEPDEDEPDEEEPRRGGAGRGGARRGGARRGRARRGRRTEPDDEDAGRRRLGDADDEPDSPDGDDSDDDDTGADDGRASARSRTWPASTRATTRLARRPPRGWRPRPTAAGCRPSCP